MTKVYRTIFICYVALIHLIWGVGLMLTTPRTTALGTIEDTLGSAAGPILIGAALLSLGYFVCQRWIPQFLMLLPQFFVLLYSSFGAVAAVAGQHYADGVARPFFFIFADQLPVLLLPLFYLSAVVLSFREEVNGG